MNKTVSKKKVLKKCSGEFDTTHKSSFSLSKFSKNKNNTKSIPFKNCENFVAQGKSLHNKNQRSHSQEIKKLRIKEVSPQKIIKKKLFQKQIEESPIKKLDKAKQLKIRVDYSIRINRGRIFDWLLDVLRAFNLGWETYWCTIQLFDYLVYEHQHVKPTNVLLVALTCLFMASKIHQSNPPRLRKDILRSAAHNTITEREVFEEQMQIMEMCFNKGPICELYNTPYNISFQLFPSINAQERVQIFKRLIWVWIDPVQALHTMDKHISYKDLICEVRKDIQEGLTTRLSRIVMKEFTIKHKCQNLEMSDASMKYLKM